MVVFYGKGLLTSHPTSKLEDNSSAVHSWLLNTFAATLYTWRESPPSASRGHLMLWWRETTLQG